ncbi:MAG: hypothetical protein HYZ50_09520 [Deltaproteobacteria bacterium]|nr:hypothetical protein [Deltaproteobacteria bacterium]
MADGQSKGRWDDLRLFDDRPKHETATDADAVGKDPLRLEPIVNVLCSHLRTALQAPKDSPEHQLRLGLFGGLGQGKTSAVKRALEQLRQEPLLPRRGLLWGKRKSRYESFDAADYKPDLLEFEFDRLVGRWYLRFHLERIALPFASILFLIGLLCYPYAVLFSALFGMSIWDFYKTMIYSVAALPLLWKMATSLRGLLQQWSLGSYLARDLERQLSLGASFREIVAKQLLPIFFPPDVFIVDNLDRANVQQQRAILRAVRKHSEQLQLPILVVMDETELLRAKPYDAEAPEELLRKAIQVECRMPIRMGDDAALLVMALAAEGRENNKSSQASLLLDDARLQGDWTRVFSLLPGLGPRHIKRFLNDLFSSCAELDVFHPDDVSALTRLYAVFSLAPDLRRLGEEVVYSLAANDEASLAALCKQIAPDDLSNSVAQFLRLTRHMQPKDGNWRRLVAKLIKAQYMGPSDDLDRLSEHLRAVGKGFADSSEGGQVSESTHKDPPEASATIVASSDQRYRRWLVVEGVLAAAGTPVERWRILVRWQARIEKEDPPLAFFLLFRVWLADAEVLALMSPADRQKLFAEVHQRGSQGLSEHALDYRTLFLLVPGQYLHFIDRVTFSSTPDLFQQRDVHSIGPWLAAGDRDPALLSQKPLFPPRASEITGLVNDAWPPFVRETESITAETCRSELEWHLTAVRMLHLQDIRVRPNSLQRAFFERRWLDRHASSVPDLLDFLCNLLLAPVAQQPGAAIPLPGARFHVLDSLLLDNQEILRSFLDALSQCDPRQVRDVQSWWTGLLIGVYYKNAQICSLWGEDILQRRRVCHDVRLLEYFAREENSILWQEEVLRKEAILQLFGSALNAFADMRIAEDQRYVEIAELLHGRLRSRQDYREILSSLQRTPTVPPRASNDYDIFPSDEYLAHLKIIANTTDYHRVATADQLLERAYTVEVRNRSLMDAISLLTGKGIKEREWKFLDFKNLTIPDRYPDAVNREFWDRFTETIAEAQKTTPQHFDDLLASFASDDQERSLDWFYFHLPYLTEGLTPSDHGVRLVTERLEKIASLCAGPSDANEVRKTGDLRIALWRDSQPRE